jgi:YVTN family beta-propeller protein
MEFRILGPLEVEGEQGPVRLHRGKEQALLIFMLLHANELLPSERLIDELWDGRPPPTAPKILQNAVSQLRKRLGDGRLETRPPGYVFHVQPGELDLDRFHQLARGGQPAEALALWRGTPLVELRDERFADDARRRLEDERLAVLEDRIDTDLQAGRHAQLIPELEALVAANRLRERLQGQLMRALYRAGRQADALEVYQRARRALNDELGLAPGPELQELERKILQQDPELSRPRRAAPPAGRRAPPRRSLVLLAALVILAGAVTGIVFATTGGSGKPLLATPNSLAVIDPGKNRVVGVVPIGSTPRGVTVGKRYVWTANTADGTVSQIDPSTLRVVQTIGVGKAATDLVEVDGLVWVATGSDDTVVRIDARSGGILGSLQLPHDFTASAYTIAAGATGIWVGSGNDIVKIDPAADAVAGRLPYKGGINAIALDGSTIWVASSNERVARFSSSAARQTAEISLGEIPTGIAVGGGSVWVAAPSPYGARAAVWRIDRLAARVTQTTLLPNAVDYATGVSVAFGAAAVWVASFDTGIVAKVDPASGEVVDAVRVGGHPSGIAVGAGRVWVTVS